MNTPALEVAGLDVSYRRAGEWARVLWDVSLAIGSGEAYGLVGESGCGKTTLALSLMRYLPRNGRIDAGTIRLDGTDLLQLPEHELRRWRGARLAMVYQDPVSALNPALRIGDQLAEVYQFQQRIGRREALRLAAEALRKVAIADPEAVVQRYPHQLSGGQQQRVVIAMALAGNPRLLLLDEPTTGLDATIEAEILDLIASLRVELDAAILLISHNLALVARVCERIGVMYAGRLVEEGRTEEVLHTPRHPYTVGLLRSGLRFGDTKQHIRLDPIPGALPVLGDRIPGCAFNPRCPLAREQCRAREPELFPAGIGRLSRCFFWNEVPQMASAGRRVLTPPEGKSAEMLLEVQGLRKTYPAPVQPLVAVDNVSMTINKGETFGLVGESGSGKTTLARCVAGLTDPEAGVLRFAGHPAPWRSDDRSLSTRRAIQMVFQNPDTTLNPSWSVRQILGRAVRVLQGLRGLALVRRVRELAQRVRLEPRHLDLRAPQLSGGLRQRVAIARAFAGNPALTICDEPVSALDVSVQAAILTLLVDLQDMEDVSYLFISHDLAVVRYIADQIGVMYLGEFVEVGRADDVFAGPQHPYTEALLSAVLTLNGERRRPRIQLQGPMPSLAAPPTGCRFHTRCPRKLGAICEREAPPWYDAGGGHLIRCHIPPEDLKQLQRLQDS